MQTVETPMDNQVLTLSLNMGTKNGVNDTQHTECQIIKNVINVTLS